MLELVGLTDAADRRTKTYSGGMKRRLDLASALVHQPKVLFLDEPTTGLDPASRLTVWDEVRSINSTGTTIFLTTQYLEEADELCDRLAIIDEGEIVAEGTPETSRPRSARTWSRSSSRRRCRAHPAGDRRAARPRSRYRRAGRARPLRRRRRLVDRGDRSPAGCRRRRGRRDLGSRPSLDDVFLEATGRRLEGAEPSEDRLPEDEAAAKAVDDGGSAARAARRPGGRSLPGGDDPDAVHPALLPGGEHRPGPDDVQREHYAVPERPELCRLPDAGLADVRRGHRDHGPRPGHRDRQRLFRQVAGGADPPHVADLRPARRRPRSRHRGLGGRAARRIAFGAHIEAGSLAPS